MAEVQKHKGSSGKGGRRRGRNGKTGPDEATAKKEMEDKKALALLRLNCGEYQTRARESSSSSSNFVSVFDKNDVYMELVQCVKCKTLYSLKARSGTTHLLRHEQSCNLAAKDSDKGIAKPMQKATKKKVKAKKRKQPTDLSFSEKANFTEKIVEMCGRDLRPFNIVTGQGFKNVLQECVKLGHEHGEVDVESFVPHPTTLSRQVSELADELREKTLPYVREAVKQGYCAMDADMWSDKYTKTNYLSVTSQHVTDEWELKSDVLCTAEFPIDEKKTGQNILEQIQDNLALLDIEVDDLKKVTFVTVQGANIKLALSSYKRIACGAHLLATVLRHLLDENNFLKEHCPNILASIKSCKNVVTYLKRSGNCKLLDKTVKQKVETRWNTEIYMLTSLCSSLQSVVEVLIEKGEMSRLNDWDGELMTELLTFLTPFKEVTEELQARKVPTMHLVLVKFYELVDNCKINTTDSEEMKLLKSKAESLKEKLEFRDVHYVSSFLCPNLRKLKRLSPTERSTAHSYVRKMYKELVLCTGTSHHSEALLSDGPTPPKKSRFGEWCESSDDEDENEASEASKLDAEISSYILSGKHCSENSAMLLKWWQKRADMYPRLARFARKVLGIPATSASSERNFSRAGLVVTEKRSSLDPEKVNDLLIIHNYYLVSFCI